MAQTRSPRVSRDARTRTFHLVWPWQWSLWGASRPFMIYVLICDVAALAVVALTMRLVPVGGQDLVWFAALASASIMHLEVMRGIERLRELHTHGRVFTNLKSVWTFAGLLVLPPPLVAALIAITYVHMWFRINRRMILHRWVFAACNVILASTAAGAVLVVAYPQSYPELPHGLLGFAAVAGAGVVRWLVNTILTGIALVLMNPGTMSLRTAFGSPEDNLIEFGSLGLGVLAAVIIVFDPAFLLALAVPVAVVHRGLLLHQFESAAHRDRTTGMHNAGFWHELAFQALERAGQLKSSVGMLLIHLDNFNSLNDFYGTTAGDRVLRRVSDAIKAQLRGEDLVGRLTQEEFAILLPATTDVDLAALAERIRLSIRELSVEADGPDGPVTISGLTVSIGGAMYPQNAGTLPDLMLVADNAMFAAKTYVRDQARFVRASTHVPAVRPAVRPVVRSATRH
jgi:diguanylate cyclase (GGDEF)-like protein